jgi:hypothetical protein
MHNTVEFAFATQLLFFVNKENPNRRYGSHYSEARVSLAQHTHIWRRPDGEDRQAFRRLIISQHTLQIYSFCFP